MTKRQRLLEQVKSHIRNGSEGLAIRLYIENNWIGFSNYQSAVREARKQANG